MVLVVAMGDNGGYNDISGGRGYIDDGVALAIMVVVIANNNGDNDNKDNHDCDN